MLTLLTAALILLPILVIVFVLITTLSKIKKLRLSALDSIPDPELREKTKRVQDEL